MYWPLWTSLVIAMHDDITNTSLGTDYVIIVMYQLIALQTGKSSMMLRTCIRSAGHRNASQLILIMEWPNTKGVLPIFVYGGVRMEGKLQTQK